MTSNEWDTKSGDCAVCGHHTAKYPLCDTCWSECIDAGDEYCGASSAWIADKVRARCAQICADIAGEVDWSARGIMQMDAEQVGIECAKQIRGEK